MSGKPQKTASDIRSISTLKTDVFSNVIKDPQSPKKFHMYGRMGEGVKIIREAGNVLIVENLDGERFPIKRDVLIIYEKEAK